MLVVPHRGLKDSCPAEAQNLRYEVIGAGHIASLDQPLARTKMLYVRLRHEGINERDRSGIAD